MHWPEQHGDKELSACWMWDDNYGSGNIAEVSGFDMDGGMELTMVKVHINVQERDMGGGGVEEEEEEEEEKEAEEEKVSYVKWTGWQTVEPYKKEN